MIFYQVGASPKSDWHRFSKTNMDLNSDSSVRETKVAECSVHVLSNFPLIKVLKVKDGTCMIKLKELADLRNAYPILKFNFVFTIESREIPIITVGF